MWMINAAALCEYANNQKDKTIDANDIMRFPIVDAEPVRHGRWISECEPHYECSVCHHWFHLYDRTNYCPNCGAKMDGDMNYVCKTVLT